MDDNEEKNDKSKRSDFRNNGFEEGYITAKKRKLEEQNLQIKANIGIQKCFDNENTECADLFQGISMHINGYTNPTSDDLKKMILAHGGNYDHYCSASTTYIIATNLAFSKASKINKDKVLKPEWIVDSIRERRILPLNEYYLFPPKKTNVLKFDTKSVESVLENVSLTPSKSKESRSKHQIITPTKKHNHFTSPAKSPTVTHYNGSPQLLNCEPSTSHGISSNVDCGSENKTLTATDPGFVQEYFRRSRLHHIATSSNDLKNYVEQLIDTHDGIFAGLETFTRKTCSDISASVYKRAIMIVDMDCFFVSVGIRKRPHLKDKPVAVTHSRTGRGPQRTVNKDNTEIQMYQNYYKRQSTNEVPENEEFEGFEDDFEGFVELQNQIETHVEEKTYDASGSWASIASCNYEARKLGIKNGMHVGEAMKLCSNLVTLPYEFEEYSKVSKILYDTVASYTLKIEAVSCDECYVDITDILNTYDIQPLELATKIRNEIFEKTNGCTSSAGIASNILLAKLALKAAKPNGQHFLPDNQAMVNSFIEGLKVKELPGIGYSTNNRLKEIFNVVTCGDLQNISLASLKKEFGEKSGKNIYDHCRGIDRSVLKIYQTQSRKSVSAVVNYGIRFKESSEVHRFMIDLAKEVSNRLDSINAKGKLITLKILTRSKDAPVQTLKFLGCGMCDSVCKSTTLRTATSNPTVIGNEAIALLKGIKHHIPDLRGIGLQIGKLEFAVSAATSNNLQQPNSHKNLLHYFNSNQTVINENTKIVNDNSNSAHDILPLQTDSSKVSPISTNSVQLDSVQQQLNSSAASFPDSFAMIDKDVLNAIPEYMRREVLSNYNIPVSSNTTQNVKQSKKGKIKKSSKTVSGNNRTREGPLDKMIRNITSGKTNLNVLPAHLSNVAHICGQTDINTILSLIREWVVTEEELLDDDYAYIFNFLMKLVEDRNYALLTNVMQTLYETISERNSEEWKVLFNNILKSIVDELSEVDRSSVEVSRMTPFKIT